MGSRFESPWEVAERRARMRLAYLLRRRGASWASIGEALGVEPVTAIKWVERWRYAHGMR